MERGRNVSASFNPVTQVCCTCLTGVHPAWRGGSEGPIVLVLSDHHFPVNIPSDGTGDCFRIFRVENGSVIEIVDNFLRVALKGGLAGGDSHPAVVRLPVWNTTRTSGSAAGTC